MHYDLNLCKKKDKKNKKKIQKTKKNLVKHHCQVASPGGGSLSTRFFFNEFFDIYKRVCPSL